MASRDEIKKTILSVAGNPESGVVKQFAGTWADAIVALDASEPTKAASKADSERTGSSYRATKETRVEGSIETR
jgi:hypothetical protein|tara:strand:- start:450 stop:671 length:222 start_codon:yes stop_codon:yes gene_type:complete